MADGLEKAATIRWHPAFCSAAEFDLRADRGNLEFEPEHNLSKEPLRMDLLIIKKRKNEPISNDIARIFRKYNVIEYKSPDDGLTIDDFYKTVGYACLYKSLTRTVDEIPGEEVTVSLFRDTRPEELISRLTAGGVIFDHTVPGIYAMNDLKPFPAQIVVMNELDSVKHAGLKILSRNASEDDIEEFLFQAETEKRQGEKLNIDAILEASYSANGNAFDNLKRRDPVMSEALKLFMKDELEEQRHQGIQEGIQQGIQEGILLGENKHAITTADFLIRQGGISFENIATAIGRSLSFVQERAKLISAENV